MAVTKGQILKYTLLPGFIPRILTFVTSGFGHLAYYIALIYSMVGLLPRDHPYLLNENIGKYGVRHAIAAASQNLVFKKENSDQVIIFFTILIGLVLIFLQFILLAISFTFYDPVFAQVTRSSGELITNLLQNPNDVTNSQGPEQDIAFIILDRVFGVEGIFNSCISTDKVACTDTRNQPIEGTANIPYPFPFHSALHLMLRFYSMGILVVGAFVIIYFIISIVGETATTGTPFGQRFNKAWAPVRIIVFFGLLIPLNVNGGQGPGLNGAQHITLWTARHGSNFATNAWGYFNTRLTTGSVAAAQQDLIATPNIPSITSLNQFMLTAKTCVFAEKNTPGNDIRAYVVRPKPPTTTGTPPPSGPPDSPDAIDFMSSSYLTALSFSQRGSITIRFGAKGRPAAGSGTTEQYSEHTGNVFPYCGEIVIQNIAEQETGSGFISRRYYEILQEMWDDDANERAATCVYRTNVNDANHETDCAEYPFDDFTIQQNQKYRTLITEALEQGIEFQKQDEDNNLNATTITGGAGTNPVILMEKGWGGAAIWYNRVAQMNGAVTAAAFNIPRAGKWPYALEQAYYYRLQQNADATNTEKYSLRASNGNLIRLPENRHITHVAIYDAYNVWERSVARNEPQTAQSENVIINTINAVLGTSGIFEIRENNTIHPLAQLTSIGKSMMETVVRNTGYAIAGYTGESVLGIIDPLPGQLGGLAKSFFFTVVASTIGIAVILFYVLPFLPFIYFIFAVSGWVKSIFEAIIAMPLWALAHIRIDGDGLSGPGASNGYFLLLEIFLRPILIVIGLVSTISIFAAMVTVLNSVFDLVVGNVGGVDTQAPPPTGNPLTGESYLQFYRGPIDEFFFTAMYAIICYITGLATFKLIDLIPNSILRWMGVSVATFQENAGDPASALTSQVYRGSILVSNQVQGATQGNLAAIVA